MKKTYSNPCSRCGTERIVSKTWEEKIGNSVIVNTIKICPNPDCQKLVDRDNKNQRDRTTALRLKSEERATQRQITRKANKDIKDKKKSKKKK